MTTNTASPIGGLMTAADSMSPTELVDHARRLEQLGYPSVWLTDVFGRDVYVTAAHLLANTDTIDVASSIYIAAHGPKMMAVAAEVADGANTYMQPPEHSRQSRATLGPDKALNVVLPSCLTTDPEQGAPRVVERCPSTCRSPPTSASGPTTGSPKRTGAPAAAIAWPLRSTSSSHAPVHRRSRGAESSVPGFETRRRPVWRKWVTSRQAQTPFPSD